MRSEVRVKICGITNLEDARIALGAGADALGFVFYKKSPRYIAPYKAKNIIESLPAYITKIGVFVNAKEEIIKRIAKLCKLDMLQFHGNEPPEFCEELKGFRIIKAFRIKDRINLKQILRYKTFAYLFDTFVESKLGGTGKRFEWELLRHVKKKCAMQRIFLSGGLNSRNVTRAIKTIQPDWVDVASSVEIKPGKKDVIKIKEFIESVKKCKTGP